MLEEHKEEGGVCVASKHENGTRSHPQSRNIRRSFIFHLLLFILLFFSPCVRAMATNNDSDSGGNKHKLPCDPSDCKEKKDHHSPVPSTESKKGDGMPSFYQRKLPETCVAFTSREGKKIFRSALLSNGLKSFYNLIEQHHTQTEPAFCGVSTLVMVLNALKVDPGKHWKGPWRWYTEKMLNCCVHMDEVKQSGITLRDFQCLAYCQGLSAEVRYPGDGSESSSLESFRRAVARACVEKPFGTGGGGKGNDDDTGFTNDGSNNGDENDDNNLLEVLVVSYSRAVLQQTGTGHFSPLAAYDEESDSVLILDTARFKYGAHWTKLPLIYDAMKPLDPETGKSRGYALLSFGVEEREESAQDSAKDSGGNTVQITTTATTMSPSIFFHSKMNQKERRQSYKEYIQSLRDDKTNGKYNQGEDITYDDVRSFWCKEICHEDGRRRSSSDVSALSTTSSSSSSSDSVWNIIKPVRVYLDEEKKLLQQIRSLLSDMRGAVRSGSGATTLSCTKCGDPGSNVDDVEEENDRFNSDETLFIIWLATLSKRNRNNFIMNAKSADTADAAATNTTEELQNSLLVRNQLIKEADMIATAIEVSDRLMTSK